MNTDRRWTGARVIRHIRGRRKHAHDRANVEAGLQKGMGYSCGTIPRRSDINSMTVWGEAGAQAERAAVGRDRYRGLLDTPTTEVERACLLGPWVALIKDRYEDEVA